MSNTFFVMLPSNTTDYPSNKPNQFRVHLPKPLQLTGNYMCALYQIQYPYSWPSTIGTLDEQWIDIKLRDRFGVGDYRSFRITINSASFQTPEDLAQHLKSSIARESRKYAEMEAVERLVRLRRFTAPFPMTIEPETIKKQPVLTAEELEKPTLRKWESVQTDGASCVRRGSKIHCIRPGPYGEQVYDSLEAAKLAEPKLFETVITQSTTPIAQALTDEQRDVGSINITVKPPPPKKPKETPTDDNATIRPPPPGKPQDAIGGKFVGSTSVTVEPPPAKKPKEAKKPKVQAPKSPTPAPPPVAVVPPQQREKPKEEEPTKQPTSTPAPPQSEKPKDEAAKPATPTLPPPQSEKPKDEAAKPATPTPPPPQAEKPKDKAAKPSTPTPSTAASEPPEKPQEEEASANAPDEIAIIAPDELPTEAPARFPLTDEIARLIGSVDINYQRGFTADGFDANRFYVTATHPAISHLEMSEQLAYVLGFREGKEIKNGSVADYETDLHGGFFSFAVYARGLTEEVILGNSLSSLLRIIPIDGNYKVGQMVDKVCEPPMFLKVLPREINEIQIELRTMTGKLVPFQYGTVMITLVFKKVINL